jgi:hypothetical protein
MTEENSVENNLSEEDALKLEILQYNYWEHFKFEKDISMVLPVNHPKRVNARRHSNELLEEIHKIKNKNASSK